MSIDEIKKLDIKDRIILMNEIWSTLESEDLKIESPLWHEEILRQRIQLIEENKAKYISIEELKA